MRIKGVNIEAILTCMLKERANQRKIEIIPSYDSRHGNPQAKTKDL